MAKAGKVWHVTDYRVLYLAWNEARNHEMDQVQYSQRHLVASVRKPEVQRCINRFAALKQTLPLAEYLMAKYVYEELLDQSQIAHTGDWKYLRGYVVDERLAAPGTARIAKMLQMKEADVKKSLTQLEKSGLFERVEIPEKPLCNAKNEDSSGEVDSDRPPSKRDLSGLHESAKGNKKENKKPKSRPSASSETEEKKKYRPSASKGKAESDAGASPTGTDDAEPEGEGQSGTAKPKAEEQAESGANLKTQGQAEGKADTAIPPTATPPIADKPTETDGGGAGNELPASPSPLDNWGDEGKLNRLYDPEAKEFAGHVYRNLGTTYPIGSPACARELASFASMWQEAVQQLAKPSLLKSAWNGAMKHACQLKKKRLRNPNQFRKSPEAVWCAKFKGLVAKLKAG